MPVTDDDFDVALNDLEGDHGIGYTMNMDAEAKQDDNIAANRAKAYPLTLGLVIHSLADGLALGASALPRSNGEAASSQLSLVVFLALVIHKGKSVHLTIPRSYC